MTEPPTGPVQDPDSRTGPGVVGKNEFYYLIQVALQNERSASRHNKVLEKMREHVQRRMLVQTTQSEVQWNPESGFKGISHGISLQGRRTAICVDEAGALPCRGPTFGKQAYNRSNLSLLDGPRRHMEAT